MTSHAVIPTSLGQYRPGAAGNRDTTLTVVDLVTVVLQTPDLPLLQHTVGHQQLEEAPMDIRHGTHSSRAALHVGGAEKEEPPSPACARAMVGGLP